MSLGSVKHPEYDCILQTHLSVFWRIPGYASLAIGSLRQGTEVDTPGDVRAPTLTNKSSSHILSLSLLVTRGETECFESSPKVQEEKLKVQTVPPRPGAVPCDPTREPMTFQ